MNVVPCFHLADSLINGNTKELEKFCDLIIGSGLVINWGGQAAIRSQMTTALLEKMARAGYSSFFWGMESASDNVLRLMNKRNDIALFGRILKDCKRLGIVNYTPIIVGYPGETPEDAAVTLRWIIMNSEFTHFTPPGLALARRKSPLYEKYLECGLKEAREYDWETVDGKNTIQLRVFRRFLFSQACYNASFCLDNLVDYKEVAPLDMNATLVAEDYIDILRELARIAGKSEGFVNGLRSISDTLNDVSETDRKNLCEVVQVNAAKASKSYARSEVVVLDDDLHGFFRLDKNTNEGRKLVYKLALELFRDVSGRD